MKVLLISADFPPTQSGEASHAYHLAKHMAKRGAEVHVLTTRVSGTPSVDSFTVHPVMKGWTWLDLSRFKRFVKRLRPEAALLLFWGGMYGHHPMITLAPTIARRSVPGLRFVTQFEYPGNDVFLSRMWTLAIRKAITRFLVRSPADHDYYYGTLLHDSHNVIVLSDAHRADLFGKRPLLGKKCTLLPAPPLLTITNDSPDVAKIKGRNFLNLQPETFLLVFYGYLYPSKGIETLFQSMASLRPRYPNLKLAIVGDFLEHTFSKSENVGSQNYKQRIQGLATELGILDMLIWTGPCQTASEKASLYFYAADACVFPFYDGVHLNNSSVSAAIVHHAPVITTYGENTEPVFVDRSNVLLCEPKNVNSLTDAIRDIIEDGKLRERLSTGAAAMANEWFSWDGTIDRTLDILRSGCAPDLQESLAPA